MTEGMNQKAGPGVSGQSGASGDDATPVSEQSASFLHPDTAAATSSQRLRLVPPDGKPLPWWIRHRDQIALLEMLLTALFFLLTLYFLWLWIFSPPAVAMVIEYSADREGFAVALSALQPIQASSTWKVAADAGRWKNIVVHHTATDGATPEAIDRHHREEKKFENGLGYHFLIGNGKGMADGEVFTSRRWLEQLDGAHVIMRDKKTGNTFSIGIALVGNFEKTVATPKQLASLRGLLSFLVAEYGIPSSAIIGHGEVSAKYTACPGKLFFLDEVIKTI